MTNSNNSKPSPSSDSTATPPKPKRKSTAKPKKITSGAPAIVRPEPKTVPFSKLDDDKRAILAQPSVFCRKVLGMELYDKQAEIMDSLAPIYSRTSAVCANEVGKTRKIITGLILWHGTVFKMGHSVSTSGSWLQVTHQLVPALKAYEAKFPQWKFTQTDIQGPLCPKWTGFSTNNSNRAEGWHGSVEEVLAAWVDEAKGVDDSIFTSIEDRVNPQRYGLFSSPGYAQGEFYRSHTKHAALYKRFKITAFDCPHITRESIDRRIKKWGINHPLVRSMIFAEFMEMVQGGMLTLADWDQCIENPPGRGGAERHAFVDFGGAGGAETVLAARIGNEVWIESAWRHANEMETVGRLVNGFAKLKREHGFQPHEIEGDADGIGGPMIDRLREVGWPISEFHGGSPALESDRYFNRIAEVWMTGCDKIRARQLRIRDAFDEDLKGQIMSRLLLTHSSGKLQVEPKQAMAARNLPSPDRADAWLGAAFRGYSDHKTTAIRYDQAQWTDNMEVDQGILDGMNAGL